MSKFSYLYLLYVVHVCNVAFWMRVFNYASIVWEEVMIATGDQFTCAGWERGTVSCWGDNSMNQTQPPAHLFKSLKAGDNHACAEFVEPTMVTNASGSFVACWGSNQYLQHDLAGVISTPGIKMISTGYENSCAVYDGDEEEGKAMCFHPLHLQDVTLICFSFKTKMNNSSVFQ